MNNLRNEETTEQELTGYSVWVLLAYIAIVVLNLLLFAYTLAYAYNHFIMNLITTKPMSFLSGLGLALLADVMWSVSAPTQPNTSVLRRLFTLGRTLIAVIIISLFVGGN